MAKVIVVTNQKGGVGKTTTSVNLSAGLGILKKKTLLIDLDPQANATQGVGLDKTKCIKINAFTMLTENKPIENYVYKTSWENLDVIPGTQDLAMLAKVQEGKGIERQTILKGKLEAIKTKYDYIIIDCPPVINELTLNGITAADSVLVPIQCEFYALEGITQLLNTVKLIKKHTNRNLLFEGFLGTMYQTGTSLSEDVYNELNKYFTDQVFKTYIRRGIALAEAPSHGKPIMYYEKNSNGTLDYMNLAKEVVYNNEKK